MKSFLKPLLIKILTKADHAICKLVAVFIIICNFRKINQSDVVVYIANGGYGHTIQDVDISRRLFQDRKLTLIYPSEVGRHNWKQAKIWPVINVLHILKSIRYHALIQNSEMEKFTLLILKLFFGFDKYELQKNMSKSSIKRKVVLASEMLELFIHDVKLKTGEIYQHPSTASVDINLAYWFKSIELYEVSKPVIPQNVLSHMHKKIRVVLGDDFKIVTIYMRVKGVGTDGELRCGSGMETYSKSIDYLIELGYTIFLVGDRSLDDCPSQDKLKYITADRLGVNQGWFNLFAVTECKLFIGDPGGGAVLPILTKVPRLMVNGYPYVQALHGYLILFKRLLHANGQDLPMETCFKQRTYHLDPLISNKVRANNEIEIFEAVKELVSVRDDIWLDYVKGEVDSFGRKISKENTLSLGRMSLGPCRLVNCQHRILR